MKIWKILNNKGYGVVCYVKVNDDVFDSSWYALKVARETIDKGLCTTQLLDVERGEQMEESIPVLEYKEV